MSNTASRPKSFLRKPLKLRKALAATLSRKPSVNSLNKLQTGVPFKSSFFQLQQVFGLMVVVNFAIGGYMLYRGTHKPRDDDLDKDDSHSNKLRNTEIQDKEKQEIHKLKPKDNPTVSLLTSPGSSVGASLIAPVSFHSPIPEPNSKPIELSDTVMRKGFQHRKEFLPDLSTEEKKEILKWILNEKRRVLPADSDERKRVDDEKRMLKDFIKMSHMPKF